MKNYQRLICVLLLFFSSEIVWASPSLILETQFDKQHLSLSNNKGESCQLNIKSDINKSQTIHLNLQSQCYFFPNGDNNAVQIYSYNDVQVLLIGGTPTVLTAIEKEQKKVKTDSYCTQEIQAFIQEKGVLRLVEKIQAFACSEDRLDEKLYRQALSQKAIELQALFVEQKPVKKEVEDSFLGSLQKKILGIFK